MPHVDPHFFGVIRPRPFSRLRVATFLLDGLGLIAPEANANALD